MAQSGFTPILTYASNTAASVPSSGNLTNSANGAELAVNTADRRLFTKNSGGSVVELGNNPSALTVVGTTTLSALTASTALALNASKEVVSVTNTGSGNNVLATSPTLVTPILGTPTSVTLTNATGLPLSTGVTGTLATTNGGTGLTSFTSGGVVYASSTSALTTGSALTFDGTNLSVNSPGTSTTFTLVDNAGRTAVFRNSLGAGGTAEIGTTTNHDFYVRAGASAGGLNSLYLQAGGVTGYSLSYAGVSTWSVGGTTAAILNSSGLEVKQSQLIGYSSYAGIGTNGLAVAGNVGIGTSSPSQNLEVSGSNAVARVSGTAGSVPQLSLSSAGVVNWTLRSNNDAASDFTIYQDSTQRLKIDSSGNLSVGTSTAVEKLTVWAGNAYVLRNGGAKLRLADQLNEVSFESVPVGSSSDAIWKTSSVERMRLDQNGNLGLGVTPSAVSGFLANKLLEIGGANSPAVIFRPSGSTSEHTIGGGGDGLVLGATGAATASNNAIRFFTSNTNSSNTPTERARISSDGTFRVKGAGTAGSTDAVQFSGSAPASAMTLNSSGGLQCVNSISVGNATPTTSGAGITFPATQSASSDANTLDDYEEGTWTPALVGTSSASYDNQVGRYTKVGRLVTIQMLIQPNSVTYTSSTAQLKISGLPFTPVAIAYDNANSWGAVSAQNLAFSGTGNDQNATTTTVTSFVTSTPEMKFVAVGQSTRGFVNNSAFPAAAVIETTITYFV